ncbi:hypothetical protein H8959_016023 [Pygathrix nigripes]
MMGPKLGSSIVSAAVGTGRERVTPTLDAELATLAAMLCLGSLTALLASGLGERVEYPVGTLTEESPGCLWCKDLHAQFQSARSGSGQVRYAWRAWRQVLPAPPAKQIPFPRLCSTARSSPTTPAWTETDRSLGEPASLEAGARALSKENPQRLPFLLQRPLDPTPPGSPRTRPAPTFPPAPTLLGLAGPPNSVQRSLSSHRARPSAFALPGPDTEVREVCCALPVRLCCSAPPERPSLNLAKEYPPRHPPARRPVPRRPRMHPPARGSQSQGRVPAIQPPSQHPVPGSSHYSSSTPYTPRRGAQPRCALGSQLQPLLCSKTREQAKAELSQPGIAALALKGPPTGITWTDRKQPAGKVVPGGTDHEAKISTEKRCAPKRDADSAGVHC